VRGVLAKPAAEINPEGGAVSVEVTRSDAVTTVTIGSARGSLDRATKDRLRDVLGEVGEDPSVRAVVLTGAGSTFCVGQDLREHAGALAADATAAWDTLRDHHNPIVTALATMPKPVVAAVNGVAAGAGASFAFACDLRLMATSAAFHLAFGGIGLSVDSGMSWTLPRLVGYGRALDLLLRARPIPASSALALGLAHEVVADDALPGRAAELAAQLAAGPTIALGAAKQALAYSAAHSLVDSLEVEAAMQTLAGTTEDHANAVRAFLAKEKPRFDGR
jgi:2-(1,2-epoxy-1,2-dihydrophenyl)acetyl-CoA isomerase